LFVKGEKVWKETDGSGSLSLTIISLHFNVIEVRFDLLDVFFRASGQHLIRDAVLS